MGLFLFMGLYCADMTREMRLPMLDMNKHHRPWSLNWGKCASVEEAYQVRERGENTCTHFVLKVHLSFKLGL